MRYLLSVLAIGLLLSTISMAAPGRPGHPGKPSTKLYELRIYYPTPGNYANIVDRFRQYTTKIFAKHGMENIGYWTPTDTSRKELIYVLAFPDKAARDASWKAFGSDPEWKKISSMPEYANDKILSNITRTFLVPTGFSQI